MSARRSFARSFALLGLALSGLPASAATVVWSGASNGDFENPANWSTLPANDLTSDVAEFSGSPTSATPTLSASRALQGLILATPSGGWTIASADSAHALTLGAGGLNASAQSNGVSTLASDVTLGATQTWQIGLGGTLRLAGAVRAGSASVPLTGQLIIGNSSTPAGEIHFTPPAGRPIALHLTLASAGALQVHQPTVLGEANGANDATHVIQNSVSAGIRVSNSGTLTVRSGVWKTNDLGSNNTASFSGTLTINGGTLATGGARYLGQINGSVGTTVNLSAGSLLVTAGGNSVSNSQYLGLGTYAAGTPTGRVTLTVSGGLLDVARGAGTLPTSVSSAAMVLGGVANTSVHVNQSGGLVRVGVTPASHVFTGAPVSNSSTHLSIGSTASANACAYTLAGGTLMVAGNVTGVTSIGGVSNFNFLGGTIAVSGFDTTKLGSSSSASLSANQTAESVSLGTLVNRGGTIAPGGEGVAGRTLITGNYTALAGRLLLDVGGTTQANAFQAGTHDFLSITGTAQLGGTLAFQLAPGFTPNSAQSFTVLTAGSISGAFANAPFGKRIASEDGLHSFIVSRSGNDVVLSAYAPVGAPEIVAANLPSTLIEGTTVVLDVTASSVGPVTYTWRRNGTVLADATGPALTLVDLGPANEGLYEVTVANAVGSVAHTFTVRPSAAPATGRESIDVGASRTFTASAGAASYRWLLDGEEVGTAASFTYTPARRAVGVHWLRVIESYADSSTLAREWALQVRLPSVTSALSLYVSPAGSDSAPGTLAAPFATLEKARDAIRVLSAEQRAGGVTVFLRGGVYRRTSTFVLSAQDSGSATAPVHYVAYPGETPILTTSRIITSAQIAPLAASEHARVAPGVDVNRLWEIDVTGNTRANAFPAVFNEWIIFNALRSSQNSGLLELFYQGERRLLSRYPNHHADDRLTPNLLMDGVAPGTAITRVTVTNPDGTTTNTYPTTSNSFLNFAGTYTTSTGTPTAVGGAFVYPAAEADRVARWASALNSGGLWVMGYWRVPWQINAARVSLIDPTNRVIGLATNPSNANEPLISGGIGDKYSRNSAGLGVGNRKEPWWVINLLEEIDVPGEWSVDFNRRKIYFLMPTDGAPADGDIELSDVSSPLIQLNGASDVRLEGLTFRRHLGLNVQILGGTRNLIRGCTFTQAGNMAVDINGGTEHGVLSSDFEKLASGGIFLRGGSATISTGATVPSAVTPSNHFAVNNRFRSFSEVVRVYQAAIDVGFGGPLGSWSVNPAVAGMRVAQNDIRSTPHAAILWHGYQHVIEYNEVSDFTRISNDFGAIYRYGPNQDNATIIRYNHLFSSTVGEGIYNDFDHVRTPIYGNVINLKTPPTSSRGYGIWTNTNNASGAAVPGIPTTLQVFNNISVNGRSNYSLHTAVGGKIENNISYRKLASDFLWYRITPNSSTNTNSVSSVTDANTIATLTSGGANRAYTTDPGFIDFANDDLRLRPDAAVYTDLPTFAPIPLELSGLHLDATRVSGNRVWKPFVVTRTVSALGANTATLHGALAYPQFDANATVRVFWGTTDGGEDPAAWQHSANLGLRRAGPLAHTPTNLEPSTKYFFRFVASNTGGEHWAERSNFTTTFPFGETPSGTATADSAALPAAHAFDGDSATLWRAESASGTLIYAFPVPTRVTRYSLTTSSDAAERDPRDWTLQGSNDGVTWVTLDAQTGQAFTSRGETRPYGFANENRFLSYRLVITANTGDAAAVALGELAFAVPQDTPDLTGPVISTPGEIVVSGTATGAIVTFTVNATDAVSGEVNAVALPTSGSNFAIGTTTVNVSATDAAGNTSTASFVVTVLPPSLPAPWTLRQITPFSGVAAGTASYNSSTGAFTIVGAGGQTTGGTTGDFWSGNSDSFTYLSQPWSGDGIFTARLASFSTPSDSLAKAGLVFRETTATGSRYSAVYFRGGSGVWFQHKTATSGASTNVNFFSGSVSRTLPQWIRLVRAGDTFSTFYSSDGATWTELGVARTNVLSGSALSVGLFVAPRTGNTNATALFDNVSFFTPLQAWRQSRFGSSVSAGTAANAADPDADGMSNLLEYALGTDPLVASPGGPNSSMAEQALQLSFFRARADLTYYVDVSDDLATWSVLAVNPGTVGETVTVSDFVPLTATTPRRFLRLRVEAP